MAERSSIISHFPRGYLTLIRASYLIICDGDHCAAMLLALFEYLTNKIFSDAEQVQKQVEEAWFAINRESLSDACLRLYSPRSIQESLITLTAKGLVQVRDKAVARGSSLYLLNIPALQAMETKTGNGPYGNFGWSNQAKLLDWTESAPIVGLPINELANPIEQNCSVKPASIEQNCSVLPLVYIEEEQELKPSYSVLEENTASTPLAEKQDSSGEEYSDMVLYLKSTLRAHAQHKPQKLNTKRWQEPLENLYEYWKSDQESVKFHWAKAIAGGKAFPAEYTLASLRSDNTSTARRKTPASASPSFGGSKTAHDPPGSSEPPEMAEFYKLVPSAKPTLRWDPKPWVRKALLNSRMFDDWANKFADAAALAETLAGTDYNQPIHFEWFIENWDRLLAGYFDNWLKPKKKTMAQRHAEITNMDLGDINNRL